MSTNTASTPPRRKVTMVVLAAVIAFIVLVVVALPFMGNVDASQALGDVSKPQTSESASPSSTPTPESCQPQYAQTPAGNDGHKVDDEFEASFASLVNERGENDETFRTQLLNRTGNSAQQLAIYAHDLGLYEDQTKWQELVTDGCLNDKGIELHTMYKGVLSMETTSFALEEAPESYFNSGVHDGVYGVSEASGIRGDRKAIKITMKDGTTAYILVRCGNPVYPGKPNLPHVPTDNPPPPTTPEPPTPPNPPEPPKPPKPGKDTSKDPYPNGNAPDGGGKNNDPGPGPYVPPQEMERPPETPRENPAPPAPKPPAPQPNNPAPKPVPTKDPAPPPPPETTAPAPTAPETVCDPSAPGATCP